MQLQPFTVTARPYGANDAATSIIKSHFALAVAVSSLCEIARFSKRAPRKYRPPFLGALFTQPYEKASTERTGRSSLIAIITPLSESELETIFRRSTAGTETETRMQGGRKGNAGRINSALRSCSQPIRRYLVGPSFFFFYFGAVGSRTFPLSRVLGTTSNKGRERERKRVGFGLGLPLTLAAFRN